MNNNVQTTFIKEDPWRIFRIMAEFVDSFETLSQVGPAVTVFGSARMSPRDPYYKAAMELARGLAQQQFGGHHRRRPGHHGGGQQRGGRRPKEDPWA